jgi:hypothetical protein
MSVVHYSCRARPVRQSGQSMHTRAIGKKMDNDFILNE